MHSIHIRSRLVLACALSACTTEQSMVSATDAPMAGLPEEPPAPPAEKPHLRVLREFAEELGRRRSATAAEADVALESAEARSPVVWNKGTPKKKFGKSGGASDQGRALEIAELWAHQELARADLSGAKALEVRQQVDRLLDVGQSSREKALDQLKLELLRVALFDGLMMDLKTRAIIGDDDIVSPNILIGNGPPIPELAADFAAFRNTMLNTQPYAAMMVRSEFLTEGADGGWTLQTRDIYDRYEICPDEKYVLNEKSVGECSAVVLTETMILTARHCLKLFHAGGGNVRFVFDYAESRGGGVPVSLPATAVFAGKIFQVGQGNRDDWVVFKTPPLPRHRIPNLALTLTPASVSLFAAGFPLGGPFKLVRQGTILEIDKDKTRIYTDLDAYQGLSGAPVFNAFGEVEAIILQGEPDFDKVGPCRKTRVCLPKPGWKGCRKEEAFRVAAVFQQLPKP